MFVTQQRLVLASGSPRRREFLEGLGIEHEVILAHIDEAPAKNEEPLEYVARMAQQKCLSVSSQRSSQWVLAADTIVFLGSRIFGKPGSKEEAVSFLLYLSGKVHSVASCFCLLSPEKSIVHNQTVVTQVSFDSISQETAENYVDTGEPMDKAGAYGIQGKGAFLVKKIKGSYTNVVGLPVTEMINALSKYGIVKHK